MTPHVRPATGLLDGGPPEFRDLLDTKAFRVGPAPSDDESPTDDDKTFTRGTCHGHTKLLPPKEDLTNALIDKKKTFFDAHEELRSTKLSSLEFMNLVQETGGNPKLFAQNDTDTTLISSFQPPWRNGVVVEAEKVDYRDTTNSFVVPNKFYRQWPDSA